MPYYGNQPSD